MMTPSMFSMGTILNTKFYLSMRAVGLFPNKKSIMYSMIKLDIVSPGCTRAVSMIAFLSLFGVSPIVR